MAAAEVVEVAGTSAVVSFAKQGIDAANTAINLYNEAVSKMIPWSTFEEIMNDLKNSQKQCSSMAADIVGRIHALLLDSNDQYHSSKEEIVQWCEMSAPVLGQYMSLFAHTTDCKVAEAQKVLLLKVLNGGSEKMSNAMAKLEKSRNSFNSAYGELTTLKSQLDNDYRQGSNYFKSRIKGLRTTGYAGAAVAGSALGGAVGAAIATAVTAVKVEGDLVPKLEREFRETKRMFENLHGVVKKAQESIDAAKISITKEIRVIGTMSAKIEETKTFAETWALVPSMLFHDLKKSTTELIEMCNQYVKASQG